MIELKTLKDIAFELTFPKAPVGIYFAESEELKAEAVKWINHYTKQESSVEMLHL